MDKAIETDNLNIVNMVIKAGAKPSLNSLDNALKKIGESFYFNIFFAVAEAGGKATNQSYNNVLGAISRIKFSMGNRSLLGQYNAIFNCIIKAGGGEFTPEFVKKAANHIVEHGKLTEQEYLFFEKDLNQLLEEQKKLNAERALAKNTKSFFCVAHNPFQLRNVSFWRLPDDANKLILEFTVDSKILNQAEVKEKVNDNYQGPK